MIPPDAPHDGGHMKPPTCYFCSWKKITWGASDTPHDAPMLFFDNLVKKLDTLSTSNIDIYRSTFKICINNLLKPFFFGSRPPPPPSPTRDHPIPSENHTYAQYFQQNPTYLLTVNV